MFTDLLAEQTEVMRVNFNEERAQIDQEKSLEAGLNDTESIEGDRVRSNCSLHKSRKMPINTANISFFFSDRAEPQDTRRNKSAGDHRIIEVKT